MLYTDAKQYLLRKLKEAGLKSNPYTTVKSLGDSRESHLGAVLSEQEAYARNGSKKRFRDEEGAKHKRHKVFDRDITFSVVIGDYNDAATESMLSRFITALDDGITVDGSFVPIELGDAVWGYDEDTLLRAKVAVRLTVIFHGGVYKDTDFGPLRHVELTGVEKEAGKETTDGK